MVAVWVSCTLCATSIDRQQATQLARDFMAKNFKSSAARRAAQTISLTSVETGQSLVYAFNVEGGGFVVVAGDDCAPAILGYSETSVMNPSDMPEGMKDLFEQYQQEMQYMIANGLRSASVETLGEEIKPLMTSKWGQGGPYNYMCPRYKIKNNKGVWVNRLSLTGCVATAMAQILYYHKFPAEITELPGEYYNNSKGITVPAFDVSKTLDWDLMLPTYGTRNKVGGTQEQKDAVAKLLRLVGQSVNMQYTPNNSSAKGALTTYSFVNYFNYDASTIKLIERRNYAYTDWVKMIYQEMVNGRPVLYNGQSNGGGHAFVVHGYEKEDLFYINWGWYDTQDLAFRLSLCNPSKKYEGGGTGDSGFSGMQSAVIGIQPASTPQSSEHLMTGYFKWCGNYNYQRASLDQNFDLAGAITQFVENITNTTEEFIYGAVVKNADGEIVQEIPSLNPDEEMMGLNAGEKINLYRLPLKVGANLGDGTYTLEFVWRYKKEEPWRYFYPTYKIMFKISENTLIFDCRPIWLTVKMEVTKQKTTQKQRYKVKVTLENKGSDKTFQRTVRLGRDEMWRPMENYGAGVMVGPGETKEIDMDYKTEQRTPVSLFLTTMEDGVPLGEGVATDVEYKTQGVTLEGKCNLTDALKKNADDTYVLNADDSYQVVYTVKNTSEKEFFGYVMLSDFIGSNKNNLEQKGSEAELVSLAPGESYDLKLTINNDGNQDVLHQVGCYKYNELDLPVSMYESELFVIQPNYDLSIDNLTVSPIESVDDELADYIVKGTQMTVSSKIVNPEATAFEGTVTLRRYVTDFNKEYEVDEDGYINIEPDKVLTKEVTIPANGSIDYTQVLDLNGLVQDTDDSVLVDFIMTYTRQGATDEVPLYYSDPYLINDGTPMGMKVTKVEHLQTESVYDLQGRRINGKPAKGIYIIGGKKFILK